MADLLASMIAALGNARGDERHADLAWTPSAYLGRVADNLHIGAERLTGALAAGVTRVYDYDQDDLAAARGYAHIPLAAALWSLDQSVDAWRGVVDKCLQRTVYVDHESRGRMSAAENACSGARCFSCARRSGDPGIGVDLMLT